MLTRRRIVLVLGALALSAAFIIGCSGGVASQRGAPEEVVLQQERAASADGAGDDAVYGESAEGPAYEMPEATMAAAPPSDAAGIAEAPAAEAEEAVEGEAQSVDAEGNPLVAALPQDRMIIKNGEISLMVEDTDSAINRVNQIAVDNGGYVLSGETWFSGEFKYATITVAVSSDRFEAAMERLRNIAIQVMSETASGQDVTSEYVDLESRLTNLEATRMRIQSFLDDAKSVEEALEINRQLSEIEAQIEQVKGRMTYLSGRSAYSTITVNLQVPTPTPTPTLTPTATPTSTPTATPTPWSPGVTVSNAVKTQTGLFQGLVEAFLWLLIVPGPYALAGLVIFAGVRALYRNGNGKAKKSPPSQPPSGQGGSGSANP